MEEYTVKEDFHENGGTFILCYTKPDEVGKRTTRKRED